MTGNAILWHLVRTLIWKCKKLLKFIPSKISWNSKNFLWTGDHAEFALKFIKKLVNTAGGISVYVTVKCNFRGGKLKMFREFSSNRRLTQIPIDPIIDTVIAKIDFRIDSFDCKSCWIDVTTKRRCQNGNPRENHLTRKSHKTLACASSFPHLCFLISIHCSILLWNYHS